MYFCTSYTDRGAFLRRPGSLSPKPAERCYGGRGATLPRLRNIAGKGWGRSHSSQNVPRNGQNDGIAEEAEAPEKADSAESSQHANEPGCHPHRPQMPHSSHEIAPLFTRKYPIFYAKTPHFSYKSTTH